MSKRKQKAPQRTTEEKRKCLSWNMMEGVPEAPSGSLSIFSDDDPALLHEIQDSQSSSSKRDNSSSITEEKESLKPAFSNTRVQEAFNQGLQQAEWCVTLKQGFEVKEKEWFAVLAKFKVKLLLEESVLEPPQNSLPQCKEFWLYSSRVKGQSMIYFEPDENDENKPSSESENKNIMFWFVDTDVPYELFEALESYNPKQLQLTSGQYDVDQHTIELTIHIREALLVQPKFPCEVSRIRKHNIQIQKLMSYFYGKAAPSYDTSTWTKKHDVDALYQVVKEIHGQEQTALDVNVQHPSLIPFLRPYQKNGVKWMLSKERFDSKETAQDSELHLMYEKILTPDGTVLFYNKYAGSLTLTPQMSVVSPPGGILADEMGLGKTVEVLACLLMHRRDESELLKPMLSPEMSENQTMGYSEHCEVESESNSNNCFNGQGSNLTIENPTLSDGCDVEGMTSDEIKIKIEVDDFVQPDNSAMEDLSYGQNTDPEIKCSEGIPAFACGDLESEVTDNCDGSRKAEECNNLQPVYLVVNKYTSDQTPNDLSDVCDDTTSASKDHMDVSMETLSDLPQQSSSDLPVIEIEIKTEPDIEITENYDNLCNVNVSVRENAIDPQDDTGQTDKMEDDKVDEQTEKYDKLCDENIGQTDEMEDDKVDEQTEKYDKLCGENIGQTDKMEDDKVDEQTEKYDKLCDENIGQTDKMEDDKVDEQTERYDNLCDENIGQTDKMEDDKLDEQTGNCDKLCEVDITVIENVNGLQDDIGQTDEVEDDKFDEQTGNSDKLHDEDVSVIENAKVVQDTVGQTDTVEEDEDDNESTVSSLTDQVNIKVQGKKSKRKGKKWTNVKKPRRKMSIDSDQKTDDPYLENKDSNKQVESVSIPSEENKNSKSDKKQRKSTRFVELVEVSEFQPKNIFSPYDPSLKPKEFFECICGLKTSELDSKRRVQCVKCRLWQHSACVNYDLKDPLRGEFKCPHCHVSSPPVPSGATLIISPSSICHQWVDEILKHIRSQSLKVFVYLGVNKQGFIQPATLAQQDIVITTYETLRKEIDYVDLPHSNSEAGRKFRHPKRFMAIPSPIIAVEWWRICLDEAQMVECTTTKTAEMALRLRAVNRWCVTGTPIQKSVSDLYGLLLFLGVDPYWVKQWWSQMLYEPFCCGMQKPLHDLVASVLWRTVKKDVIDQINLPQQTEQIHWLQFSPIEDHFYRRQYQECITVARRDLCKWTDLTVRLSSLDRHTVNQLLHPLLRLRQACCHPQAVRGEFLPLQKTTMTMGELLESLTKKAKTECEESHRQLVAALNGLAGLDIIKKQYKEAVDNYREVLRSVEEHKKDLRTDDLQQLHAMYNLQEVLQLKPKGVGSTLRDDKLQEQCKELTEKYLAKTAAKVTSCQETLEPTQQTLRELTDELRYGTEWWLEVVTFAEHRQLDYRLVDTVQNDLRKNVVEDARNMPRTIANLFETAGGLELVLQPRIEALQSAHDKLVKGIKKLSKRLTQDRINKTVQCCLRPLEGIANSCEYCEVNKLFQDYESKLFLTQLKEKTLVDVEGKASTQTLTEGNWRDGEVEKALKSIISFAKLFGVDRDVVQYGVTYIKKLETQKKEFRNLRAVWMALYEQVQAIDELDMATTRLRLRLPDEEVPDSTRMNIIEPAEMEQQKLKLLSDKTVGKNELRKKLGQLFYLKNLAKAETENEKGINPEPCPICQRELGVEWSVMLCGHCYCLECIRVMVVQYSFGSSNRRLRCAMCRQTSFQSDISYVSTKKSDAWQSQIRVKGSYSTKIEGVVGCVLQIHKDDPQGKVLIFSTWTSVLGIISKAFTENDITHRCLYAQGKFQENLTSFKEDEGVTALLLPIHSGANGLNLIEATYVILVEPVLNPAQELQAIGRVHRIGQKRSTQVHRFLVKGTIEEKMHSVLKSIEDCPSSHNTEENVLTIGHLTSLLQEEREESNLSVTGDETPGSLPVDDTISSHVRSVSLGGHSSTSGITSVITAVPGCSHQSTETYPSSNADHTSETDKADVITQPMSIEVTSDHPTEQSLTERADVTSQPMNIEVTTDYTAEQSLTERADVTSQPMSIEVTTDRTTDQSLTERADLTSQPMSSEVTISTDKDFTAVEDSVSSTRENYQPVMEESERVLSVNTKVMASDDHESIPNSKVNDGGTDSNDVEKIVVESCSSSQPMRIDFTTSYGNGAATDHPMNDSVANGREEDLPVMERGDSSLPINSVITTSFVDSVIADCPLNDGDTFDVST